MRAVAGDWRFGLIGPSGSASDRDPGFDGVVIRAHGSVGSIQKTRSRQSSNIGINVAVIAP